MLPFVMDSMCSLDVGAHSRPRHKYKVEPVTGVIGFGIHRKSAGRRFLVGRSGIGRVEVRSPLLRRELESVVPKDLGGKPRVAEGLELVQPQQSSPAGST